MWLSRRQGIGLQSRLFQYEDVHGCVIAASCACKLSASKRRIYIPVPATAVSIYAFTFSADVRFGKSNYDKKKKTEEYLCQCPGIKPFPYENINQDHTEWINAWCEWGNIDATKLAKDKWFTIIRDDINEPFKIHPPKSPAAVIMARNAGPRCDRVPNLRQNMTVVDESAAATPKKR